MPRGNRHSGFGGLILLIVAVALVITALRQVHSSPSTSEFQNEILRGEAWRVTNYVDEGRNHKLHVMASLAFTGGVCLSDKVVLPNGDKITTQYEFDRDRALQQIWTHDSKIPNHEQVTKP